jgi:hypothetical protein
MTLLVELGESPDSPRSVPGVEHELNNKPATAG